MNKTSSPNRSDLYSLVHSQYNSYFDYIPKKKEVGYNPELPYFHLVPRDRIELPTRGFSDLKTVFIKNNNIKLLADFIAFFK